MTAVGLAVTVKSWTTNVTVAEWDRLPLVPVTVTWTVPADGKLQERVEVPDPETLPGVSVQTEVSLLARVTTPANPLRPVTVIVEVAAVLAFVVTLVGLAVTV